MAITSRVGIHPETSAVRELNTDEFSGLLESIREHGQLVPIRTYRGQVIDGRATLRACQRLRIQPRFEEVDRDTDPKAIIDALNLKRRHLSVSELAMAAARLGIRKPDDLAKLGTSLRTVQSAAKVYRDGAPETIEAAERGEVAVSLASRLTDLPHTEQAEAINTIRSGRKSEVTNRIRAQCEPDPVAEPEPVTPAIIVEQFRGAVDRLETIRLLVAELAEHELMIARTFFGIEEIQAPTPATISVSAPAEEFTIEVIRDRVSDEMIASPKMLGLASRLGSKAAAVGVIRLMLAATAKHAPRGDVGRLSDAAFAQACEWSGRGEDFVSSLVQEGWLVRDRDHRLLVVDWPALCPPEIAEELIGNGEGFAEPTGPPAKVKERNPRRIRDAAPVVYSVAFERFWGAYPDLRKTRKAEAWLAWQKAVQKAASPDGQNVEEWLIKRAGDFAKSWKGKSQFCQSPAVWLNGGCWDDSPVAWTDIDAKGSGASSVEVLRPMKPMTPMRR